MAVLGTLSELWRYPVKSMGGESLGRAAVTEHGLLGDRCWALRDEETGLILDGKKLPRLMQCRAKYLEEPTPEAVDTPLPVAIVLPNGMELLSDDDYVDQQLSEFCGRPVALLRRELPNTYFDVHVLHLLTTATLAELQRQAPATTMSPLRFRPNFLIESEAVLADPQQGWFGKSLSLGSLELSLETPTERCSMIMRAQRGVDEDAEVLRSVVETGNMVGLYGSIDKPGYAEVGQELEALSP